MDMDMAHIELNHMHCELDWIASVLEPNSLAIGAAQPTGAQVWVRGWLLSSASRPWSGVVFYNRG